MSRAREARGPGTRALVTLLVVAVGLLTGCTSAPAPSNGPVRDLRITDYTRFVDNNQGPGQVFMRYPMGRVGLWSTSEGEIADSVTRGLLLYPTVDQVADKGTADWRASVSASPAQTDITYASGVPTRGSAVQLTVTPDVSVYRYHFGRASAYAAVDLLMADTENSNVTWSASRFTYIDRQTAEVTLSGGGLRCFYYIKFSSPATGHGTFTAGGARNGATSINGVGVGGFLTFAPGTAVTVAVALSMTSMATAERNFTSEFGAFDFAAAVRNLRSAWNAELGKVDVRRASTLTAREIYTGLYTVYANIINVTDNGSGYAPVRPSTRLLTIGSSVYWAYIGGGYFRCSFDQGRNVYAFLTLIDPAVMRDVLNTYLSQYNRDGFLMGNWDPYDPPAWSDQQWGFFGYFFLTAKLEGVTGVDYHAAEAAILATMGMKATTRYLARIGFYRYGYVPANVGTIRYLSRGLEFSTDLAGLAHLGYVLGDRATYQTYAPWGTAYLKTWNPASKIFQAKNTDGSWAAANTGLNEGTTRTYAFDEPQDGLGLARVYGDNVMSAKIASIYGAPNTPYNDFQVTQPYLAIAADSPSVSQQVIRNYFLPEFSSLTMWDEFPGDGITYYTNNASAEVLANLGIYPIQSPGAQWILNSPAVAAAVIHGRRDTVIDAPGNSPSTPYVRAITVNGASYPSEFISGATLAARATTLSFAMTAAPARIATAYVTATTGEILAASTDGRSYLRASVDPLGPAAELTVHAAAAPVSVTANGAALPRSGWSYSPAARLLILHAVPPGTLLIRFR